MIRTGMVMLALALPGCAAITAEADGAKPAVVAGLEGGPWLVEDINGGGVIDNARIDMTFDAGDHGTSAVYGRSGCNRYRGPWQQDGATVKFGPLAGTMMACAPALMDLEQKFLQTLAAVTTISFDATGAAVLRAPDGRAVRIRKAPK